MKAVALLSGGLDSVVSMLLAAQDAEIILALTIDYGQKARINELRASRNITSHYGIPHQVIELPFMSKLSSDLTEPGADEIINPWVPNRNGLFLNLAAALAEDLEAGLVVCGFNREEADNFPDNSRGFIEAVNQAMTYSTRNGVRAVSYVLDMDKVEIIKAASSLGIDFRMLWSCYQDGNRPCGKCPSCLKNLQAFRKAGIDYCEDFIY